MRGWPVTTIAAGEVLWHEGRVTSRPGRGRFVPAGLPVRPADRPQSWLR